MILQVDIGNSYLKWRVLEAGRVCFSGREETSSATIMEEVKFWHYIQSVYVASVALNDVDRRLRDLLKAKLPGLNPEFVKSEASFGCVLNAYEEPFQLGVDRWLAVIAGYHMYRESCFVVDCGSAITVDAVDFRGKHQGGYILPGLGLMTRSLLAGTSRVECVGGLDDVGVKYGVTTSGCVKAGVGFVLVSMLEGLRARMKGEGVERLILTGGDGEYAASLCDYAEYHPDLVLDGLSLVGGVKV